MPQPSPYDLVRKASGRATATDRWAVLKNNAQERIAVAPLPQSAAPSPHRAEPRGGSLPEPIIPQPPFPPPQQRHPHLDEIATRHAQATRAALEPREWNPAKAREQPPPPVEHPRP